jgi:hypothetical protein
MLFIVLALFSFFLKKETSKPIFTKIIQSRIFEIVKPRLEDPLDSFYENLPTFKDVFLPFILSLIGWIVRFSLLFGISHLFSINIPFISFILIIAVANVVASLPISIYGLGTREATLITLFSIFSVPPETILSLSLFWFAIIWLSPSIAGAVITIIESKNLKKPLQKQRKKTL